MPALTLRVNGVAVASGQQVIPDVRVGSAVDYWLLEVHADPSWTLTGGKAWLGLDTAGVPVAISCPDGTARPATYAWTVAPSGLTYAAPTTAAAGLSLPTLTPGTKSLVVLRRSPSSGTSATPQRTTVRVDGTWNP